MIVRWVVMAVGAALTATACTGGKPGTEQPTGSPASRSFGEVIDEASGLRPLALGAKPLWDSRTEAGFKSVGAAVLHGDAEVLTGTDRHDRGRLAVVDATTGKPRWSVRDFGPLRGGGGAEWVDAYGDPATNHIVGTDADWGILVAYYATGCRHPTGFCPVGDGPSDETGVALLSGKDGGVRWKTPLVPPRRGAAARAANRLHAALAGGDDTLTLGTVAPRVDARITDVRLIAIDTATGRRLWTRSGVQPSLLAGGTVFGRVSTKAGLPVTQLNSGSVVALDAKTGRTRWDLSARLPGSLPILAAGNLVLVRPAGSPANLGPPLLLDAGTGRELARLPALTTDCKTDGQTLIACLAGDSPQTRLITIGLGDHKVRVAKQSLTGAYLLRSVWRGHIFVEEASHSAAIDLDRSAHTLAGDLPGQPADISDRYAIFVTRTGRQTHYSTYRLR
jgi:outer membrane protein assembly factor BamB